MPTIPITLNIRIELELEVPEGVTVKGAAAAGSGSHSPSSRPQESSPSSSRRQSDPGTSAAHPGSGLSPASEAQQRMIMAKAYARGWLVKGDREQNKRFRDLMERIAGVRDTRNLAADHVTPLKKAIESEDPSGEGVPF